MTLSRGADNWGVAALGAFCLVLALCGVGLFHVVVVNTAQTCEERHIVYDRDFRMFHSGTFVPFSNKCNPDPGSDLVPGYVNPGVAVAGTATLLFLVTGLGAELRSRRPRHPTGTPVRGSPDGDVRER